MDEHPSALPRALADHVAAGRLTIEQARFIADRVDPAHHVGPAGDLLRLAARRIPQGARSRQPTPWQASKQEARAARQAIKQEAKAARREARKRRLRARRHARRIADKARRDLAECPLCGTRAGRPCPRCGT